ncbi:MAG: hypothetical protein IH588_12560 [Anaerolineales bacterium]|nr:hypothetical protein [Anaerolineales bacterium]
MTSIIKISPKEILATESYKYKIDIRNNVSVELDSEPQGTLEVLMPYDGEKYFPKDAADELLKDNSLDQLQIGWLALGRPKDWQGDWRQKIGAEILEVRIPLRMNGVSEENWTADEDLAHLRHQYTLEWPRYYPINIDLEVLDAEAESKFIKLMEADRLKSEGTSLLSFEMLIQVNLPTYQDGVDVSVELDRLTLTWPKFASRKQIQIHMLQLGPADSKEWTKVEWSYVPQRNEIDVILDPVKLKPNRPITGNPLSVFWTIFHFDFLFSIGDLLEKDELVGSATFRVKNSLLSGRDVAWINADGRERKDTTERILCQTLITSSFTAHLSNRFANKQSFISREWRFPGVSFSPARAKDITSILQDHGYLIIPRDDNQDGMISAWRSIVQSEHEPYILYIFIVAQGMGATSTKRERRKDVEDDIYVTEINTQDLVIRLRAQINGPGRILALDVDEIMLRLKNHFAAVADLR